MAFNEKLNKLLEEIEKKKTFNYDIVFGYNNQFMKQNTSCKIQSIINGGKRCKLVVGCDSIHCSKGYWEGPQKV
jgi:hypothetical protein